MWLGLRNHPAGELEARPTLPDQEPGAPEERVGAPDVHTPLAIDVLDAFHRTMGEQGSNMKRASRECLSKFSRSCKAEPQLTGGVDYPAMCGAMCNDACRTPLWVTKMRCEMAYHFKLLVEANGGAKAPMQGELAVLVQAGADGEAARFFSIVACWSQSGPPPAAQAFVESCDSATCGCG